MIKITRQTHIKFNLENFGEFKFSLVYCKKYLQKWINDDFRDFWKRVVNYMSSTTSVNYFARLLSKNKLAIINEKLTREESRVLLDMIGGTVVSALSYSFRRRERSQRCVSWDQRRRVRRQKQNHDNDMLLIWPEKKIRTSHLALVSCRNATLIKKEPKKRYVKEFRNLTEKLYMPW